MDYASNYELSDRQVIFWSKFKIFYASIDSLNEQAHNILLKPSDFQIRVKDAEKEKKQRENDDQSDEEDSE